MDAPLRRAAAAALALAFLIPPRLAAAQSDEDVNAARRLATQGSEALTGGKYAEALDLVSRAEQLFHAPTHLLMIARAQVGLGRLVAAQETYLKLTREDLSAPASPAQKRSHDAFVHAQQEGKDELAALEPRIAQIKIVLEGAGQKKVTVKIDDRQIPAALIGVYGPIDPGKHEVAAYPVGGSPVKSAVELKDGEKKDLKLTIVDGPPGPGVPLNPVDNPDAQPPGPDKPVKPASPGFMTPLRGVGIGLSVVGVAGVAVGAVFMAKGGSTQSDSDAKFNACSPHCTPPQQADITSLDQSAASAKTAGVGLLVGGGVALAGGVTLIILGKPKPSPKPAGAFVTPWFSGTGAGLRGAF